MLIQLTTDNLEQYYQDYSKIYTKRFKRKLDKKDLLNQLSRSSIYMYVDKGQVLGFMRYTVLNTKDKYLKYVKSKKALFLSDLAAMSSNKGVGKALMKFLLKLADKMKLPIVTVPWNDKLLQYYTKFGFGAYYFKDSSLPSVILVRPTKAKQTMKQLVENIGLTEGMEILLEDDDGDDDSNSGDDSNGDDDEDDDESVGNFDIKTKIQLSNIKSNIDKLIKLSESMLVSNSSDFSDVLTQLYKIRYFFVIFVNNYSQYESNDQKKIITNTLTVLKQIIQSINKLL